METTIVVKNTRCGLVTSPEVIKRLREIIRVENDIWKRKQSDFKIPKYKSYVTPKGTFSTGLLDTVYEELHKLGEKVKIVDKRVKPSFPEEQHIMDCFKYAPYKLRPYQVDLVFKALSKPYGIIHAATGAGKTITLWMLAKIWDLDTVVIVDNSDLAKQLRQSAADFFECQTSEIGYIGGGQFSTKKITIALVQTLDSKFPKKKKQVKTYLESVGMVVVDECHNAQAGRFQKALRACKNAYVRHGFSATPESSLVKIEYEDKYGNKKKKKFLDPYILESILGRVIHKVSLGELIDSGYLCKPNIYVLKNSLYWDESPLHYTKEYARIIVRCKERNELICKVIKHYYDRGEKIVGFVERIEHGEIIRDLLVQSYGISPNEVAFVSADESMSEYERERIIGEFKDGDLPIMFGTVFNEGIDFVCGAAINMAGGESPRKAIQRLGRALRKTKGEKGQIDLDSGEEADYIDFSDYDHPYFVPHSRMRVSTYEGEGLEVKYLTFEQMEELNEDNS